MESARRFRALLSDMGLKYPDAAKLLHVSLRTLHNWATGTHAVPYASIKLLRLLRYMELPGKDWEGWHFSRGALVTPEGRTISAQDSAWWSLMVLRARSFSTLYTKLHPVKVGGSGVGGAHAAAQLQAIAPPQTPWDNEPCPQNSPALQPQLPKHPDGNHGDNHLGLGPIWGQSDTIEAPWPLISDCLLSSISPPAPTASASESPLIPSSASHLMPICNSTAQSQNPQRLPLSRLFPSLSQSPAQSQSSGNSPRSPLRPAKASPLSQSSRQSPPKRTGTSSQRGTDSPKVSSLQGGAV